MSTRRNEVSSSIDSSSVTMLDFRDLLMGGRGLPRSGDLLPPAPNLGLVKASAMGEVGVTDERCSVGRGGTGGASSD